MAFSNNIQIQLGNGGTNQPQPGFDYISGMIFKTSNPPSGFTYSVAQEIFSVAQAESMGIFGNYTDETRATSKITISATGVSGDTINVKVIEPSINGTFNTVNIGTFTLNSSDTSNNQTATDLSAYINTQYALTGYQAGTPIGGSFSMSARSGLGTIINGTTPVITVASVGTLAASAGAFSGGINSIRAGEHYQISEFFRQSPNGILWVDFETSFGTYQCIQTIQNQASNSIRQIGIFDSGATVSAGILSDIGAINSQCVTLFNNYAPVSVIYAPNIYSTALTSLPNLRTLTDQYVSCIIGQDGGNLGAWLSLYYGSSVPCWGSVLGLCSAANVGYDIGWVQQFNISNGSEMAIPALSNNMSGNSLYANLFASQFGLLNQLDAYGYIFAMNRPNLTGTWVNDSHVANLPTSDYNYIERVRVICKAARIAYTALSPYINGPLNINTDGTLNSLTIAQLIGSLNPSLNQMVIDGNISQFKVIINPRQNVVSTSTVQVQIKIIPLGVARTIDVLLSYTTSL